MIIRREQRNMSNVKYERYITNTSRGYFGIGIENGKKILNLGTLWRSAHCFGAAFIFTIGNRYGHQSSDTMKSQRHIPFFHYKSFEQFYESIPDSCQLIGVDICTEAKPIENFVHPERSIYLLGAEDYGLSEKAIKSCNYIIQFKSKYSLNVAVAGSIVMYDRNIKKYG